MDLGRLFVYLRHREEVPRVLQRAVHAVAGDDRGNSSAQLAVAASAICGHSSVLFRPLDTNLVPVDTLALLVPTAAVHTSEPVG